MKTIDENSNFRVAWDFFILLEKVPLFKYCSPVLRNVLLLALKPQTYAPGVLIARAGETGTEFNCIKDEYLEFREVLK